MAKKRSLAVPRSANDPGSPLAASLWSNFDGADFHFISPRAGESLSDLLDRVVAAQEQLHKMQELLEQSITIQEQLQELL